MYPKFFDNGSYIHLKLARPQPHSEATYDEPVTDIQSLTISPKLKILQERTKMAKIKSSQVLCIYVQHKAEVIHPGHGTHQDVP